MTNVVHFPDTPRAKADLKRRSSFGALPAEYNVAVLKVMQNSMIGHRDDPDNFREMDRTELRHAAVTSFGIFFCALMNARAGLEDRNGALATPDTGLNLRHFANGAMQRMRDYQKTRLNGRIIGVGPEDTQDILTRERDYAHAVFTALRVEAQNNPDFVEIDFWCDVFRGIADSDTSGAILRAAAMVLLDHLPEFRHALSFHTPIHQKA